jgi:hypothetical protein
MTAVGLAAALIACPAQAQTPLDSGFEGVRFGATSAELLQQFGARATRLGRPLDFGDAYVDVVLRNYELGGHPFIVYFQIDRASRTLKRIQIERPRHGAVAMVHQALVVALAERYGEPDRVCAGYEARPDPQAIDERIWLGRGVVIRAVFRERSLGVLESRKLGIDDFEVWEHSLDGKPQQLFVRIAPAGTEPETCGKAP